MSLCFVQNPKGWLQLAKFDNDRQVWITINGKYPYEYEDTRFRKACIWLDEGFKFYPDKVALSSASPIAIPNKILGEIRKENETQSSIGLRPSLDTRAFFESLHIEDTKESTKAKKSAKTIALLQKAKKDSNIQIPSWLH